MRMLALGLGVIVGLVALAPARLLLPAPPLAATSVTGSLWQAQLSGAALGRMQLGDVALALQPGALLKGRLSWQTAGSLNGQIWRGFTAGGVVGMNGRLIGSPLPGLPLAGISLADVMATRVGAGRCEAAGGQVTADLALPLAVRFAPLVAMHVPGHYFTNGTPGRNAFLKGLHDAGRLVVLLGLPRSRMGRSCVWLVVFASAADTVAELMARMTDRRIRHLPILAEGRLTGVISIGDVVKCQIDEATREAESLRTYIAAG
jgi:hypothetical protein